MTPFFSVIVPVYNVEPYLRECVDSILGQTFADFELILVDDGSPDGCPAICDDYARADSRVSVIHKKNGGHTSARNAGTDASSGEYVCYVDSDDYVEPDWLQTIHDDITANDCPELLIYGYYENAEDIQRAVKNPLAPGFYDMDALREKVYPTMLSDRSASVFGTGSIRSNIWIKPGKRTLYEKCTLRDERISIGEDIAMTYELMFAAGSVYISEKPLYHYRVRSGSMMTSAAAEKRMADIALVYDYMNGDLAARYPQFSRSLNDWAARELIRIITLFCGMKGSVSAVRHALKTTHFSDRVRLAGLPLRIRLFILPLKLRLVFVSVLAQKLINALYS